MQNREEIPGEPIQWKHTEQYAKELVEEGILTKDEVDFNLSMFRGDQSEDAYNWLISQASTKHLIKFNQDDPIEDWPFIIFDQDDEITPEEELDNFLEKNYQGPIKSKKIGNFVLGICGNFSVIFSMYRIASRFSKKGEFFSRNIVENIAELALLSMGIISIKESLKEN